MTYRPIVIEITKEDIELRTGRTITDQEWSDFVDERPAGIGRTVAARRIAEEFSEEETVV